MTETIPDYETDDDGILRRSGHDSLDYSDGDANEERVAAIVAGATDLGSWSDELIGRCDDWPTTYHFSPRRTNLFRPFLPLLEGASVLELGCGCGAITRILGEHAASVLAVEGSRRRAGIAAARCRDLPGVRILCDDINALPDLGRFQVVTLIGVLEYVRMFQSAESRAAGIDPVQELLAKARSFLAPGGRLFLAIENQLGLRYLAGSPEDHLNLPFAGVVDAYAAGDPVTFSRRALARHLDRAGFTRQEWHAPVPDYKLPISVIHPDGFAAAAEDRFDAAAIMAHSVIHDPPLVERGLLFPMDRTWTVLQNADLLLDLANSFLVVAAVDAVPPAVPAGRLATHYGFAGRRRYAKATAFVEGPDGIRVRRCSLATPDDDEQTEGEFAQTVADEIYHHGVPVQRALSAVTARRGWTAAEVAEVLHPWFDWLKQRARDEQGSLVAPATLLDATPYNVLLDHDAFRAFDLEWNLGDRETVPFADLVVHLLHCGLRHLSCVAEPGPRTPLVMQRLVGRVVTRWGLGCDRSTWRRANALLHTVLARAFTTNGVVAPQKKRLAVAHGEICISWSSWDRKTLKGVVPVLVRSARAWQRRADRWLPPHSLRGRLARGLLRSPLRLARRLAGR